MCGFPSIKFSGSLIIVIMFLGLCVRLSIILYLLPLSYLESSDSSMLWVLIRMKANVVLGPSFYLYPILCLSAGTSWLKELLLSKSAK
jgi:hypothetical protein